MTLGVGFGCGCRKWAAGHNCRAMAVGSVSTFEIGDIFYELDMSGIWKHRAQSADSHIFWAAIIVFLDVTKMRPQYILATGMGGQKCVVYVTIQHHGYVWKMNSFFPCLVEWKAWAHHIVMSPSIVTYHKLFQMLMTIRISVKVEVRRCQQKLNSCWNGPGTVKGLTGYTP